MAQIDLERLHGMVDVDFDIGTESHHFLACPPDVGLGLRDEVILSHK